MVEIIDKVNQFVLGFFPRSVFVVFILMLSLAFLLRKRIFSKTGRIKIDLAWITSSSLAILFTVMTGLTDSTRHRVMEIIAQMNETRQLLGHEANTFDLKWCRSWADAPALSIQPNLKDELCEAAGDTRSTSIALGVSPSTSGRWEDMGRYETKPILYLSSISNYAEAQIDSDFRARIPYNIFKYNNYVLQLKDNIPEIRWMVFISLLRTIFFHLAAAAAAFRLARAWKELYDAQTEAKQAQLEPQGTTRHGLHAPEDSNEAGGSAQSADRSEEPPATGPADHGADHAGASDAAPHPSEIASRERQAGQNPRQADEQESAQRNS